MGGAATEGRGFAVTHSGDAAEVLAATEPFLASQEVAHNVIHGLLRSRAHSGAAGHYWVVRRGDDPAGIVFQSPLGHQAALTPMPAGAAQAAAAAIAGAGFALPGVEGDAGTAATFAGHWSEVARTGARPTLAMRMSVLGTLTLPVGVPGRLRWAEADDTAVGPYLDAFAVEVGEVPLPAAATRTRVTDRQIALWEVGGVSVCLVGHTAPVNAMVRIGPVYTPPAHRRRGYAGACTGAVSAAMVSQGHRCMLFTDLDNPTSNAVYRALGYQAVGETIRYSFGAESDT